MSFVFEIGQIYHGATLSLRAYRQRAQDSEVKVVSHGLSFEMSVIIQIVYNCTLKICLTPPIGQ